MERKYYFASPLREADRQWSKPIKIALDNLNIDYYNHDQFGEMLDGVTTEVKQFAGKDFNVYPADAAKKIADIELEQLKYMKGLIVCLPPSYHEFTQGVAIELGICIIQHKPILLFIDKSRPVDNLSLLLHFYDKLKIVYIEDNIEDNIISFIREEESNDTGKE